MGNPKNKITPEQIQQMKDELTEITQNFCDDDKIIIKDFRKGEICFVKV